MSWFGKKSDYEIKYPTPYSEVSDDELYSRFKTDNWAKLSLQEKTDTFQELENRLAVEQNREPAKIEAETNSSNYGSYARRSNTICIQFDENEKNYSYEMLDSYYHESRHAQQHQAIETGKGMDKTTMDVFETEFGKNYVGGGTYYDMQTCEMDSNNYAALKMLENKNRFSNEKDFDKYLESRQRHFEELNESCTKDNYEYRKRMQLTNAYKSLNDGKINNKQANRILNRVNKEDYDPVLKQSLSVEKDIKAENEQRQTAEKINTDGETSSESFESRTAEDIEPDESASPERNGDGESAESVESGGAEPEEKTENLESIYGGEEQTDHRNYYEGHADGEAGKENIYGGGDSSEHQGYYEGRSDGEAGGENIYESSAEASVKSEGGGHGADSDGDDDGESNANQSAYYNTHT